MEGMTVPVPQRDIGGCGCETPRDLYDGRNTDPYARGTDEFFCAEKKTWGLEGYPVAMVYAPLQRFDHIYDPDTAMKRGTIFEELDLPFKGSDTGKGGCCHG